MTTVWGRESDVLQTFACWHLTRREQEAALLALAGMSVKETASLLGVRPSTVKTLRRRAYRKAGMPADSPHVAPIQFGKRVLTESRKRRIRQESRAA